MRKKNLKFLGDGTVITGCPQGEICVMSLTFQFW